MQESIDATGKYIDRVGQGSISIMARGDQGRQGLLHQRDEQGRRGMLDRSDLAIGQSVETTSDKGEKLTVKRTAYVAADDVAN